MVKICEEVNVKYDVVSEWFSEVMLEVGKTLDRAKEGSEILPKTGHIDFEDARLAFKKYHKLVVISRVDKAANCLCVMCKACYIRIAKAEVDGDGYEKIGNDGDSADEVMKIITDKQLEFLKSEHLPAPKEFFMVGRKRYVRSTRLQPTRYLLSLIHI